MLRLFSIVFDPVNRVRFEKSIYFFLRRNPVFLAEHWQQNIINSETVNTFQTVARKSLGTVSESSNIYLKVVERFCFAAHALRHLLT